MNAFGHIMTLLSFVYALAIGHVLLSVAALIRASAQVKFSWIFAFWLLNALVSLVANWISFWDLRSLPDWSISVIFLSLGISVINYVQAALTCPDVPAEGEVDLVAFHDEQHRRYIGAFLVLCVVSLIANFIFGGMLNVMEWSLQNLAVIPMIAVSAAAAFFDRRWVQIAAPVVVAAIWGVYFVALQSALY